MLSRCVLQYILLNKKISDLILWMIKGSNVKEFSYDRA
ncbi:MAG: hypothetical protein PG977_000955 [Bartonella clarridgeiae]|nr:MAG: hypothetical protein PG977_000955 [Bartonella clarridgeiae]